MSLLNFVICIKLIIYLVKHCRPQLLIEPVRFIYLTLIYAAAQLISRPELQDVNINHAAAKNCSVSASSANKSRADSFEGGSYFSLKLLVNFER